VSFEDVEQPEPASTGPLAPVPPEGVLRPPLAGSCMLQGLWHGGRAAHTTHDASMGGLCGWGAPAAQVDYCISSTYTGLAADPAWSDARNPPPLLCPGSGTPGHPPRLCVTPAPNAPTTTRRSTSPRPGPERLASERPGLAEFRPVVPRRPAPRACNGSNQPRRRVIIAQPRANLYPHAFASSDPCFSNRLPSASAA
jgi:hypothetical protein